MVGRYFLSKNSEDSKNHGCNSYIATEKSQHWTFLHTEKLPVNKFKLICVNCCWKGNPWLHLTLAENSFYLAQNFHIIVLPGHAQSCVWKMLPWKNHTYLMGCWNFNVQITSWMQSSHYVNFRKQVGFIQSPQCFLSFLVSYHYRDTM